jgi:hypothetical protein
VQPNIQDFMSDSSSEKKRLFTRIPFETKGVLNTFPGKHACTLVDISLKGALVEKPSPPWDTKIGEPCTLFVDLAEGDASIQMTGEVAHLAGGRLGVRCKEIDLESITNLRRLVELNLGDEDILNREISAMVGIDR